MLLWRSFLTSHTGEGRIVDSVSNFESPISETQIGLDSFSDNFQIVAKDVFYLSYPFDSNKMLLIELVILLTVFNLLLKCKLVS